MTRPGCSVPRNAFEPAAGEAGAEKPLELGSVSSPKAEIWDGEAATEEDRGASIPGSLRGKGVLHATQTIVPGGFDNPQCGHSVARGMGSCCESYDTRHV